ncbi:MAG TPA: hypothetical protein VJ508_03025, partial [Saprospiraceae bacterium]|nr:hypothetical protein [Saprospiraceae bacterium]
MGCTEDETIASKVELKNHSVTPALVKGLPSGVRVFSLIGSDDQLFGSPNFVFGGSADGMGIWKNADGTFALVVNHEDNFAVSRIKFDDTFKPVSGEYIVNSDKGQWRLCSATLATPDEHGFGPTFLTCGESGETSMTHALDPNMTAGGNTTLLTALGQYSGENAMPLPKNAYLGKTVILTMDDDSGPGGGQVGMYVGNTGDLTGGSLYLMSRNDGKQTETDMKIGQDIAVTFKKVPDASVGGDVINSTVVNDLKAIKFGRVEDVDYRKGGNGREVYFNVTGQAWSGANADSSRTKYGRVYKLILDPSDWTKGTLRCILDGDDRAGIAGKFQNPDGICVTNNYVYIEEDPNGYGDETHDAYIYQYTISTGQMQVVMELDHKRGDAYYNVGGDSKFGSWEYGAMTDISDIIGIENTFALCIQPHTWKGAKYKGVDGGAKRPNEEQASQIIIVKGLPR